MMTDSLYTTLQNRFKVEKVLKEEVIQTLWSGYGKIVRLYLLGGELSSVVLKQIQLPNESNHPRGWNTDLSHLRKLKSYRVEVAWYQKWAGRCSDDCRVPTCYYTESIGENHTLILEDLDVAGFPTRRSSLNIEEAKIVLNWLANFHAHFMCERTTDLWQEGSYWHLATRPEEWAAMKEGNLKEMASKIDQALSRCVYQTIIHGDAKVANFCFSKDMQRVAAVDFQYVGTGCGMKDVVYLLSSCWSESKCKLYEEVALHYYFAELKVALEKNKKKIHFSSLEKEWRAMYPIAWADFTRFLMGWMPTHHKINDYSAKMVNLALSSLK